MGQLRTANKRHNRALARAIAKPATVAPSTKVEAVKSPKTTAA